MPVRAFAAAFLLLALGPVRSANAQARDSAPVRADTEVARVSAGDLVLPGIAGSALGVTAGFYAGSALGWGGGDDPGLTGGVVGGGLGSSLLVGAFIAGAADGRLPLERTLGPALLAALAGVGGGLLAAEAMSEWNDGIGFVLGYSIVQGTVAAVLSAAAQ